MPKSVLKGFFFENSVKNYSADVSVLSVINNKVNRDGIKSFKHPFWVIDYSISGGTYCRVKSCDWVERKAGSVHLYSPGTRYWEKSLSKDQTGYSSFITFYGGKCLDLEKYVNKSNGFCCFIDKYGKLEKILTETAAKAGLKGEKSYWFVMSKLYEIVEVLHSSKETVDVSERIIDANNSDDVNRDEVFVQSLREYLQKHINENIGINQLAKHLNVSISTVSHKYRILTGETPGQTLSKLRISAIKNLLLKGEPLKTIAEQTGFYDEFHLSKAFKKSTGISPSKYMKNIFK
jgi:AraC-like DNA-binding protein